MGNGVRWTKERDAQLSKLREQGLSSEQIATKLGGVTRNAVIGRAARLGLVTQDKRPKSVRKPRLVNHGCYFKTTSDTPPPVPAIDQRSEAPVALLDLEPHHCRWPVRDAPYAFCGDTKQDGSSYCGHHFGVSRRGVANPY
jgi:GcrA cell cycle regulator